MILKVLKVQMLRLPHSRERRYALCYCILSQLRAVTLGYHLELRTSTGVEYRRSIIDSREWRLLVRRCDLSDKASAPSSKLVKVPGSLLLRR
mmetsp:Transcript_42922/g.100763  ORF Transcript_42922/g.100763 Transcript_42922/m.100763 type:complete len:92 (-) Transcript_42922:775-1050(-)